MGFSGTQPNDAATVPISSQYSPQNNSFPAMQGADGAYVDAYGNASTAPVMSFIQPRPVQRAIAVTGSGAKSLSCSFPNPCMGGNSIVVCVGVGDTEDTFTGFTVVDTQGNAYIKAVSPLQGVLLESAIYFVPGIKPGQNTITFNITGPTATPTGISMKIYEVWGLINSIDMLDEVVAGNGSSGLAPSTNILVPSVPNELVFTALAVKNITTITPGPGWSANDGTLFPWGGNLGAFDSQIKQVSTIAPITPQAYFSLSTPWAMSCAAFRSIVLPVEGTFSQSPCTNSVITSVAASTSPVPLIGGYQSRMGLTIFNESTSVLYVAFAGTVSKSLYTVQIAGGGFYEMPQPVYQGSIWGVWSSANGFARVTDLS